MMPNQETSSRGVGRISDKIPKQTTANTTGIFFSTRWFSIYLPPLTLWRSTSVVPLVEGQYFTLAPNIENIARSIQ